MSNSKIQELACYVAGKRVAGNQRLSVHSPYDGRLVGTVVLAGRADTEAAIQSARSEGGPALTRYQRSAILDRARQLLEERREEFAQLITAESGLCIRETRYETG